MLRTSVSPNIFQAGYRNNVIPSEAKATLDVRVLPDEDTTNFSPQLRGRRRPRGRGRASAAADTRPRAAGIARIDNEALRAVEASVTKHYGTIVVPMMGTGATDMAFLRAKGVQCYGIGPATDEEDGPKGFGAHSDQERILEGELYRFVRFNIDVATALARAGH